MSHTPYQQEAQFAIERAEKKAAEIAHPDDRNAFLVGYLRAEFIGLATRAQLASQHDNIARRLSRCPISVEDAGELVEAISAGLRLTFDSGTPPDALQGVLDALSVVDGQITLLCQEIEERPALAEAA